MKNRYYLLSLFLLLSLSGLAQSGRWSWGVGANVHLSNLELGVAPVAVSDLLLRPGCSLLARYRLNRKANWRWGRLHNRQALYWETGLRADWLGYSYDWRDKNLARNYFALEIPLSLVLVSAPSFSWWRKRKLHGYGRFGGSIGLVPGRRVQEENAGIMEETDIGGLRYSLGIAAGLLKKHPGHRQSAVGIFFRAGLSTLARGRLQQKQGEAAVDFTNTGSLVGVEWQYFFGKQAAASSLPEKPVDMILCPRL